MATELAARKRDVLGKKVKKLREGGLIPAELYGRGADNFHLAVAAKDFNGILKEAGESSIINLDMEGDKRPVLIYNIQRHPVNDDIISIDFYQVRLDEKVETTVPIELVGEPPAVKDKDGVLIQVIRELEIEAFPADIPRSVKVDVSFLIDIDQSIFVKDLKLGENVKITAEPEAVVATVQARMTEEEEEAMKAESADVAEIKVEGEEKKKEEEAEAAEAPAEEEKKEK